VHDNHLSAGLVRLHDAVSFTDFLKADVSHRLDVQPAGCGIRGNLLKGDVREGKPPGTCGPAKSRPENRAQ
jgi:hypothetical protein